MKNLLLIVALFMTGITFSQSQPKVKTIVIQTSAECGDCKERIEGKLNYTKGIKFAELNLDDKKVTVKYNTSKISELEIKKIIAKVGYDADEVKAIPTAVQKLPKCCQPDGMKK